MASTSLDLHELSPSLFPRTCSLLTSAIEQEVAPGIVAGLWQKSNPTIISVTAVGKRRIFPSSLPMLPDTVFDLASISKVIATAALAANFVERGWLKWNTPVAAIFPEFKFKKIQVRHLLSHTAGYCAWVPLWEWMRQQFPFAPLSSIPIRVRQRAMREKVFSITPDVEVEEKALYSDISFLMLGFVLEEIAQMPLDQAVQKFVWKPMGIRGTFYRKVTRAPDEAIKDSVAATENSSWRGGVLQGQVHDDNCWAMGGYGGHAGVFGAARDVLYFSKKLLEGFLSPSTLKAIWTRVPMPPGCDRTLGWDTPSGEQSSSGRLFSKNSVGHLGFTGTSLWIDPEAEIAVTLLSNRVHPSRDNIKIREFRPLFHDAIRMDLGR
jgi:CubicO group peptidase (beta-lactamase class C family)